MQNRAIACAVLLSVVFSMSGSGQNPDAAPNPAPPSVDLPKGNNTWAVRVIRSGGLVGDNSLDMTITSEGEVTIASGSGSRKMKLVAEELKALRSLVMNTKTFKTESQVDYGCLDCYLTALTVRRREPDGKDQKYSAFWNPTTASLPSPELVQIAATTLSFKF